jgi:hypothetical protein
MSKLLREYLKLALGLRPLLEGTIRPERPYFGVKFSNAPVPVKTAITAALTKKRVKVNPDDLDRRLVGVLTPDGSELNINLLNRDFTPDEIGAANSLAKGKRPQRNAEFDKSPNVYSMSVTPGAKYSWLVSKGEELHAEAGALQNLQASFDEATQGGRKPITVQIAGKNFSGVGGIIKNENKAAHSDFILVDTSGNQIEGTGISHKVQKGNMPPQTYSAVTRLLQNLNASGSGDKNEKKLIDFTQKFIEESTATYKDMLVAGETSYVSGWYAEIDDPKIAEVFIYGPKGDPADECAFIIVSDIAGMTLKKAGNLYKLDVGENGHLYARDAKNNIPSDTSHKPILMFRPGTGGSTSRISLTPPELKSISAVKDSMPEAVSLQGTNLVIQYKVHAGPMAKAPGGRAATTLKKVQSVVANALSAKKTSRR